MENLVSELERLKNQLIENEKEINRLIVKSFTHEQLRDYDYLSIQKEAIVNEIEKAKEVIRLESVKTQTSFKNDFVTISYVPEKEIWDTNVLDRLYEAYPELFEDAKKIKKAYSVIKFRNEKE